MTTFIAQLFKSIPEFEPRPWTNVYIFTAADQATSVTVAQSLVTSEQAMHYQDVQFLYARVSTFATGDNNYVTVPINESGERTRSSNSLPLYNTCRVDISVVGGGRPSRKYYRLPIAEADQSDGVLESAFVTSMEGWISDLISGAVSAGGQLVDPDLQAWNTGTVFNRVQMRQLHRRRRRAVA